MVLPTLLKHEATATVGDGTQKSYRCHVKEPHVYAKQYYLETKHFPTNLDSFADNIS